MILPRVRKLARDHNWFATTVDLVILVLGVFIGMQASNWNQGRINRNEGHEYRLRLVDDLSSNIDDLEDRGKYYAIVRAHAAAALADLTGSGPRDDRAFLIHAFEATQINPRKVKRFTYDEMLARGATPWVGDAKLREQIANYYVGLDTTGLTFDSVTGYRELVRSNMPNDAQLAVRRDCPERIRFAADGSGLAQLSGPCALKLPADVAARDAAAVRAIPGLVAALNRLIADHDGKLLLIKPLIAHARGLRATIEKADR